MARMTKYLSDSCEEVQLYYFGNHSNFIRSENRRESDLLTIQGLDSHGAEEINKTLREMLYYFRDAERDSDDIYVHVFPEILLKTIRRKCPKAVKELYSWICDDDFYVLTSFHQYVVTEYKLLIGKIVL